MLYNEDNNVNSANNVTPDIYIKQQPMERQEALSSIRQTILASLPQGFQEVMQYGMIGYVVPHEIYPNGYHVNPKEPLPFIALANQKGFIALYHMGMYADTSLLDWFKISYEALQIGKLDMGKSCIRFKKMDKIPLDLISQLCSRLSIEDYVSIYEANMMRKETN